MFVSEEEYLQEPELYECETCPYRIEHSRLTEHDREVLELHRQLSGRAVQDLHLTELVFDLARLRMTRQEAELLIPKLELIHEFANPETPSDEEEEERDVRGHDRAGRSAPDEQTAPSLLSRSFDTGPPVRLT